MLAWAIATQSRDDGPIQVQDPARQTLAPRRRSDRRAHVVRGADVARKQDHAARREFAQLVERNFADASARKTDAQNAPRERAEVSRAARRSRTRRIQRS